MFDAKSLLDSLMRGAQPEQGRSAQGSGQGLGGLGDILGQLAGAGSGSASNAAPTGGGLGDILGQLQKQIGGGAGGSGGGLGDILGKVLMPGGGQPAANQAPSGQPSAPAPAGQGGGGLGDILGELQKQLGQAGQAAGKATGVGGGSLIDILGQVLGQATAGVKEGAGRLDQATGASSKARDAIGQATGKSPDELLAQLQELIKNNQLGSGAALGGLGALVLGTRAGRSAAVGAAKLGALALIGGLAYKAYQNYSQGKPLIAATPAGHALVSEPAPAGSGFEAQAVSNDDAVLYLKAMIAAAAADGRIDENEQKRILGGLAQSGIDDAAHSFLRQELDNPASPDDLAAAVTGQEQAVQVYTAARLAIEPHSDAEAEFLGELAGKLGIDADLAKHIDAAARAA